MSRNSKALPGDHHMIVKIVDNPYIVSVKMLGFLRITRDALGRMPGAKVRFCPIRKATSPSGITDGYTAAKIREASTAFDGIPRRPLFPTCSYGVLSCSKWRGVDAIAFYRFLFASICFCVLACPVLIYKRICSGPAAGPGHPRMAWPPPLKWKLSR